LAIAAHTGPPRPDNAHVAEANAAPAIPAVRGASRNGLRATEVSDVFIWEFLELTWNGPTYLRRARVDHGRRGDGKSSKLNGC